MWPWCSFEDLSVAKDSCALVKSLLGCLLQDVGPRGGRLLLCACLHKLLHAPDLG